MKRRIRTLIRSGWFLVPVKCSRTPYDYWTSNPKHDDPNEDDYRSMVNWCTATVKKGEFDSSMHSYSGTMEPGVKRFVFKHERDALMFRLRWE
jgi:hypothetical protein